MMNLHTPIIMIQICFLINQFYCFNVCIWPHPGGSIVTFMSPYTFIIHPSPNINFWAGAPQITSKEFVYCMPFDRAETGNKVWYKKKKLEPHSMDSQGHQHRRKKLSPKIALHSKVLCESKVMLP